MNTVVRSDVAVVGDAGTSGFVWSGLPSSVFSYRIDCFADFNRNGGGDAPPTDHVWSIAVPTPTGEAVVSASHSTTFDAAACASFSAP